MTSDVETAEITSGRAGATPGHVPALMPVQVIPSEPSIEVAPARLPVSRPAAVKPTQGLTLSVVIPTWNEAANIGPVLEQLARFDDIVLVDAFSEDRTVEVAREVRPDLRLVQRKPLGKGDALRAGFAAASGDVIVMLDADCSMDPGDIEHYVVAIEEGADLVKGSRYLSGGGSVDISRLRQFGNAGLLRATNLLYRTSFTELCYGYMRLPPQPFAGPPPAEHRVRDRDRNRRPRCSWRASGSTRSPASRCRG